MACTCRSPLAIIGDEFTRIVAWEHGPDVAWLITQPVQLHFNLKDADLFAARCRGVCEA
jgi:hypothetical protein